MGRLEPIGSPAHCFMGNVVLCPLAAWSRRASEPILNPAHVPGSLLGDVVHALRLSLQRRWRQTPKVVILPKLADSRNLDPPTGLLLHSSV